MENRVDMQESWRVLHFQGRGKNVETEELAEEETSYGDGVGMEKHGSLGNVLYG